MRNSTVVLVSGPLAAGKTSLSRELARRLALPLISKDAIKEILFDTLGHGDRQWGEKLNLPTYGVLCYTLEQHLASGASVILESPIDADFPRQAIADLQSTYDFACMQIICHTHPQVLIERFSARIGAPDRHPGHNDQAIFDDYRDWLGRADPEVSPLPLAGPVMTLDTTDFGSVDTDTLARDLEASMFGLSF